MIETKEQREQCNTRIGNAESRLSSQTLQLDTIYNEDCLVGMQRIPDGMVDAIITDLPYGVLNEQSEGGQWDSIIPLEPMWEQFLRVTKPNAPIILFGQGMFTADLMQSNRKMWRYNLIWDKSLKSGFLNANRMPLRQHEDIAVFYRELPTYNPQMVKVPPHKRNHSKGNMQKPTQNRCYGKFVETPTIISDEKYPSSILFFPKEHINGKSYHPTEKPVNLLRYLILTYTNPGGGNSGCNHRFWYDCRRGYYGASAFHRLRNRRNLLPQGSRPHRRPPRQSDVLLMVSPL